MGDVVADARAKALVSFMEAAKELGIDLFALAEQAERDVMKNYDGGQALYIINEIRIAQVEVVGRGKKDASVGLAV
ncbi:hypothetical protein KKQ10_04110 [Pseudomonas sp. MG-9]|uniref:Uncharacterized protein n=1 Tax=Pseudomonas serboccidentalis TaxID=2964670 RepID=A0ABY7Z760_9PSED|nr:MULTISPECIES: hypothetical protein [Pseudomonas]MBT9264043.1 hypothetical protein [Pseudomonas sp. MG-9]WDR35320.1 hypothetical protein NN484_22935 [Pseudomonas serboccidentalis]